MDRACGVRAANFSSRTSQTRRSVGTGFLGCLQKNKRTSTSTTKTLLQLCSWDLPKAVVTTVPTKKLSKRIAL